MCMKNEIIFFFLFDPIKPIFIEQLVIVMND